MQQQQQQSKHSDKCCKIMTIINFVSSTIILQNCRICKFSKDSKLFLSISKYTFISIITFTIDEEKPNKSFKRHLTLLLF